MGGEGYIEMLRLVQLRLKATAGTRAKVTVSTPAPVSSQSTLCDSDLQWNRGGVPQGLHEVETNPNRFSIPVTHYMTAYTTKSVIFSFCLYSILFKLKHTFITRV